MINQSEENLSIIYFGNDWSAENRTSSHHIAEQFSKKYNMVYVECPGLRAPSMSGRDVRKIFSKLKKMLRGPQRLSENFSVYSLFQLPFHGSKLVRKINPLIVKIQILRLIYSRKFKDPILWFVIPHLGYLPSMMKRYYAVYYCIDKYAALPGVNKTAINQLDEELTKSSGTVFVASDTLYKDKKKLNSNVHISPHGVDFDHFSKAKSGDLNIPDVIKQIKTPIVGFFGLLEEWIDLSIFTAIAEAYPNLSLVIIGHAAVDVSELAKYRNIHLLGKKSFQDLPAYAAKFDVGIMPYHLTEQVINSNPLKLREYLAIGCPVVSVKFPQAIKFSDYINIASSKEEFVKMVGEVIDEDSEDKTQIRQQAIMGETWETRAKNAIEITINDKLNSN